MKIQWISRLAGGVGVIVILSTLMSPLMAQTEFNLSPTLAKIQLTPSQQTQVEALSAQTQSQLKELLTPQQQAQLNEAVSEGNGVRSAVMGLDLSLRQRRQMRNILQTMRSQLNTILTPEQKQQMRESLQTLQHSQQ